MTSVEKAPGVDESPESCPELDDEYFAQIDECFDVIDVWEDKSDDAGGPLQGVSSNGIASESKSHVSRLCPRTESSRSGSNTDPRMRNRDNFINKRSKSPERQRRSPNRRASRFSPPGRKRRSRTPPRHRRIPSKRNNPSIRPSFLEEITQQIPEIKQDMMRHNMELAFNNNAPNLAPNYGYNMQPMMPQIMQNQGFMPPGFIHPQQLHNGPLINPFVQQQQFSFNKFGHDLMNEQIRIDLAPRIPMPVPAPQPLASPEVEFISRPQEHKKNQQQNGEQQKRSVTEEDEEALHKHAKKKAFDEGKIGIADYLRQVSRQSKKDATVADMRSKREKVQERCKNAAKLLDELSANKTKLPFVFCPSAKSVPAMKSDPKLSWKSPLVMSDNNSQFSIQASFSSCRDAIQANPLRNISGKLFQFSRNMGIDLVAMSQQVQRQVDLEREKEICMAAVNEISGATINRALKKSQRSTQTDFIACMKCEERKSITVASRSTQVRMPSKEISTQYEPETESFNVSLNARTIQTMSREQHNALVALCSAFNINDQRFDRPIIDDENHGFLRERDDRMNFANPENPDVDMFISFDSPIRKSLSRSPKRRSVTERLGQKIQSPCSSQFYNDVISNGGHSGYYGMNEYRIPSPQLRSERFSRLERSPLLPREPRRHISRSRSPRPVSRKRSRSPVTKRRGRY